ncbi:MAG TPA: M28 family metallopeptidase [Candidatus Acidoferrum sp.]|nr:M28 family metallopeptidase [Candidatus Acidoferrum sp.]
MPSSHRAFAISFVFGLLFLAVPAFSHSFQGTPSIAGFSPADTAVEQSLESKLLAIPDAQNAEANLRHLTSQPHLAGTEASHQVAEWLLGQYRSFGFDAHIVEYSVWLAFPKEISLEMIAPEKKTLATPEAPVPQDPQTSDKRAVRAYNTYSASGDVTAPIVYVNYGLPADYRELEKLGISVEGKIALARYGGAYRGIKAKVAEEHHAAALILYSDPADDGYQAGDTFPNGPWRPMSGIQRGSVAYMQIYPGDPLTPGIAATPDLDPSKRLSPANAPSLPRIPVMPINAQDAAVLLSNLSGPHVPRAWQGGLPFTYHVGPGKSEAHMKVEMDYAQRPIYDVLAILHGQDDNQWVILGNHHDAWVFGAVDPSSGTASMLEAGRALGQLVRDGWKPKRTIVIAQWDGEEPGLLGSTEWVEGHMAELQAKAVAYINTDVGVAGPNFTPTSTASLDDFIRSVTREVSDPQSGLSVYDAWKARVASDRQSTTQRPAGNARPENLGADRSETPIAGLGAGSDYVAFFDHAGIPSMDLGFSGDYGVYHSIYDDFYWMQHFGDPTFRYHAAMADILGIMALRLADADVLPFDYSLYAEEISAASTRLRARVEKEPQDAADLQPVLAASAKFTASAARAQVALASLVTHPVDAQKEAEINRELVEVEQDFLAPDGMLGRPWYRHTIYAPGSYAGYATQLLPGVTEALDRNDPAALSHESADLAAAIDRASARLDAITSLVYAP